MILFLVNRTEEGKAEEKSKAITYPVEFRVNQNLYPNYVSKNEMLIPPMKTSLLFITVIIVASCAKPNSKTETIDSTQLATDTLASKVVNSMETVIEPEPTLVISDSTANALNALVNSKFNALCQDSANYYKVEMKDYYDEYEGQDVMQKYTWYFDKEFSVVYSKYSYQNGAMFKPDVTEYIVRNKSIECTIETSFVNDDDKSITVWDIQNGGVKLNWSRYSKKAESVEPIAADYSKKIKMHGR